MLDGQSHHGAMGPPFQPCVSATDDGSATSKGLWYDSPRNDKGLEIFVLAQTPYRERLLEAQPALYADYIQSYGRHFLSDKVRGHQEVDRWGDSISCGTPLCWLLRASPRAGPQALLAS